MKEKKFMKIDFISFSFSKGGAAIAADKFKSLVLKLNCSVDGISQDNAGGYQFFKRLVSFSLGKLERDKNAIKHSLNLFSYPPVPKSFQEKKSLHHIHWINNDTLSIFDFDKIPSGSILTLHDEWLYCGTEHCYQVGDNSDFFAVGYPWFSRKYSGIPWHAIIWRIKLKKLSRRRDLIITVPSNWILERAKRSLILKELPIYLLPNPIDVDTFYARRHENNLSLREQCGFKSEDFVFCFGAVGGKNNPLKGSHLLEKAFEVLISSLSESESNKIKIITFGGSEQGSDKLCGVDVYQMGHISSPADLAEVYSSADCVVVPSLVESFGQVAAEALACETPVISFACSGLLDIVVDGKTGLTAEAYDVDQLAERFKLMALLPEIERSEMGKRGRKHVVKSFSYSVIAEKYQMIIDEAKKLKVLHF